MLINFRLPHRIYRRSGYPGDGAVVFAGGAQPEPRVVVLTRGRISDFRSGVMGGRTACRPSGEPREIKLFLTASLATCEVQDPALPGSAFRPVIPEISSLQKHHSIILCPIRDGIFGFLQNFIHRSVPCTSLPDQSSFIQHSYNGSAVAITSYFDPAILDPTSDIGILLSETIRLGLSVFGPLFVCRRRRIDQIKAKRDSVFAKSVI